MRLFEAIMDDGKDVFKASATAKNLKGFKECYGGNGEFIRIKDITSVISIYNDLIKTLHEIMMEDGE